MSDSNGGEDVQDFAASREEYVFGDDEQEDDEPLHHPQGVTGAQVSDESWEDLLSYTGEVDYYALLGLPKKPPPSDADIRAAYHRLSAAFHPDKHPPGQQDAARRQFQRIREALDTLLDPKKRVIYDMLGEEGTRKEYGRGGVMRHEAYGRTNEIGPKALNPKEFRQWFIGEMKKRERTALEGLVNSRTGLTLGVNAIPVFASNTSESPRRFALPIVRPSSFFLRSSFRVPFSLGPATSEETDEGSVNEADGVKDTQRIEAMGIEGYLSVNASIGGQVQRKKKDVHVQDLDTGEVGTRSISLPPSILARSLSLGTTASITVPGVSISDSQEGWTLQQATRQVLQGCDIEMGGQVLPQPSCRFALTRSFTPVKKAESFLLRVQTTYNHLPYQLPPVLNISMSRSLGSYKSGYVAWNSGSMFWPPSLNPLFTPLRQFHNNSQDSLMTSREPSSFTFGVHGYVPPSEMPEKSSDSDTLTQPAGETWGLEVTASPAGGNLSLNYGRNLFRGQVPRQKVSEWTFDGRDKAPVEIPHPITAVRLEVQTAISMDGSLTWSVRGNRKFGDFTWAGLGVGVQGARGLVFSLTWNRLGQSINVPIAVCPLKLVDPDLAVAAVAIPWLAYSCVFYGVLKPRAKRRRKEALHRKKHELEKLMLRRKEESEEAIALMRPIVQRRQDKETRNGGLVILNAQYGLAIDGRRRKRGSSKDSGVFVDVTLPVAALVHNGQLVIARSTDKSQLIGFYDLAPLRPKVLRVRYRFAHREHFVEVGDDEDLACPQREHET